MKYALKKIFSIATLTFFLPLLSYAAPELILTWKANTYVPENFTGKALPIASSAIDASVILVNGGKVISLNPYDINWYAGEDRVTGGKGKANARLTAPATGQDALELRVHILKYENQPLDAFLTIPITRPEIVIAKKPHAQTQGFSIIPYFWNILNPNELAIAWDDNEDSITARATNKKNALEFARMTIPKQ